MLVLLSFACPEMTRVIYVVINAITTQTHTCTYINTSTYTHTSMHTNAHTRSHTQTHVIHICITISNEFGYLSRMNICCETQTRRCVGPYPINSAPPPVSPPPFPRYLLLLTTPTCLLSPCRHSSESSHHAPRCTQRYGSQRHLDVQRTSGQTEFLPCTSHGAWIWHLDQ